MKSSRRKGATPNTTVAVESTTPGATNQRFGGPYDTSAASALPRPDRNPNAPIAKRRLYATVRIEPTTAARTARFDATPISSTSASNSDSFATNPKTSGTPAIDAAVTTVTIVVSRQPESARGLP